MSEALRFELDTAPFEEQLLEAEAKLRRFREEEKSSIVSASVPYAGGKQGEQPAVSLVVSGKTEAPANGNIQDGNRDKPENRTEEQLIVLLRELLTCATQNSQLLEQIQELLQEVVENQEQSLRLTETDDDDITECVEYL